MGGGAEGRVMGGGAEGKVALARWDWGAGGVWVCLSWHSHSSQAWPVVEDQRGPEFSLHHPPAQSPCSPCCWLLTLILI